MTRSTSQPDRRTAVRFALMVALLLVVIGVHNVMIQRTYNITYNQMVRGHLAPLPDMLHSLLPYCAQLSTKCNIAVRTYIGFTVLACMLRLGGARLWSVLTVLGVQIAILLTVRMILFTVTALPPSEPGCHRSRTFLRSCSSQDLHRHLLTGRMNGGCGDMLFSSHIMLVVLCTLTLVHHEVLPLPAAVMWAIPVVLSVCTLMARMHYTVDIMLSYVFAVVVFNATVDKM